MKGRSAHNTEDIKARLEDTCLLVHFEGSHTVHILLVPV